MTQKPTIPIWFFIGILLTIYGALILGAGIHDYAASGAATWAMPSLHLQIWWGLLLVVLGLVYVIAFRNKRDSHHGKSDERS